MKYRALIYFTGILVFFSACNSTKNLADNENLYVGADIKIKSSDNLSKKKQKPLKVELSSLLRPAPNSSILGIKFKLWIYNIAGTPKKNKGFKHWLKYKVGEPPVLASGAAFEKNRAILQNRLENRGYFHDSVTVDTILRNKKVKAVYTANIDKQYTIRSVSFPDDFSNISRQMQKMKKRSLLKKGQPYDLDVVKAERVRIDTRLKERGYFYFSPDFLVVNVDSTVGTQQVNMAVKLKRQTPAQAKEVYHINDVVVFADYDINSDTSVHQKGAVNYEGYTIIDPQKKFYPGIFSRTLVFKPGDVYNRTDHNLSLNRLTTLGVYKFVKARFEETDTAKNNALNAFYYLTPTEKKSIRLELSGLTKSNNSTGGEVALSWRNRNLLKGAELFTASIYGGLEDQVSGGNQNSVSTRRLGIDLNLYLPRIIGPYNFKTNSGYVPKTRINAGYELFNRNTQYTLNSIKGSFGYVWKESATKEHQLNIISINYVKPTNITPDFQNQLDSNITLARSIERQFTIGSNYNFNYNSQARPNRKLNNIYFNANLDLSGNILGLITGANVDKGKEKKIFNTPFSQYTKVELDFRHYLRLGEFSSIASRVTGGVGFSYGNSNTLPFVKQFFAGGTNDIRAYRARSLGPGSYKNMQDTGFLPDQPGDVKLELNAEYRTKLFSIVRWALFVDAGNIWTLRDDPQRPGSKFTKNFLQQFAVGAGTGLRFDVSILILRLDLAFPIRDPSIVDGSKWTFNRINFANSVLNLAIGYPF